jgi:hypothetical protein
MVLKVIPNMDNHLPHSLLRRNMSIFLRNYMLHMRPNVLNWIEIRRIWRVLMALHSKLLSDRNRDGNEARINDASMRGLASSEARLANLSMRRGEACL